MPLMRGPYTHVRCQQHHSRQFHVQSELDHTPNSRERNGWQWRWKPANAILTWSSSHPVPSGHCVSGFILQPFRSNCAACICTRYMLYHSYEDVCARSKYLSYGYIITFQRIQWDVINYAFHRYLLRSPYLTFQDDDDIPYQLVALFQCKDIFPCIISIIKMRLSWDGLIFVMGIRIYLYRNTTRLCCFSEASLTDIFFLRSIHG